MAKLTSRKSVWCPIPGDEDGASIKIIHLKPGEIQRIEASTSEWLGKSVDDKFNTELKFNPTTQLRKLRIAAIEGWKGFYDESGNQLECTQKNKEAYLDEDPVLGDTLDGAEMKFSDWVDKFRKDLADSVKAKEAEAEGN